MEMNESDANVGKFGKDSGVRIKQLQAIAFLCKKSVFLQKNMISKYVKQNKKFRR